MNDRWISTKASISVLYLITLLSALLFTYVWTVDGSYIPVWQQATVPLLFIVTMSIEGLFLKNEYTLDEAKFSKEELYLTESEKAYNVDSNL
jgi:hypothetical protein